MSIVTEEFGTTPATPAASEQSGHGVDSRAERTQREGGDGIRLAHESPRETRLAEVQTAVNPLLEAAQPLLRALCDMPKDLSAPQIDVLHQLLTREVSRFRDICNSAQIRYEHVVAASYALCTAIDEAVQRKYWGGGTGAETGVWAAKPLAQQFHEDSDGGEKVFLLIGRLAASPQAHIDLLDLMFFILSVGFEGRYRTMPQGRLQLEAIRHRLYDIVMPARGEVPRELSPHWKGEGAGKFRILRTVPVWVTVSVLSLASQFSWYKFQLVQKSDEVEAGIRAIGALRPPVPVHESLPLKEPLAPEMGAGTVSVEEAISKR